MTRFAIPSSLVFARLITLLLSVAMLAVPLVGCGATSTDTGNPPLVDDKSIRVTPVGDGVRISAGAGAVSPGGADIEVQNSTTGATASTTADGDGSFAVEIEGSPGDGFRVVVTAGGKSTRVTVAPGSGSDPGTDLEGRQFLLESSEGYTPVEDTTISVGFSDGTFGFSAGCNSHSGDYTLCNGKLCLQDLGSTEIGCEPDRDAQDAWLADFFTNQPALDLEGNRLTFTGEEATLVFLDREVANPDRPLTGRTWTVDTFFDGGAASNIPIDEPPTLEFGEDGTLSFYTGCNSGMGDYSVDGQDITFADLTWTERGCPSTAAQRAEEHMIEVLMNTVTFEIDAQRLTIMSGSLGVGAVTD